MDIENASQLNARVPSPASPGSAILVQLASAGGMTGGRRGGSSIAHRPALLSIGGLIWQSPLPDTREQADFFNGAAERINSPNARLSNGGSL